MLGDANALPPDLRRKELADFLRARRESLSPEQLGLPRLRRRRTPGLRREEVAFMAGIGAAWYARLEMGHDITPSSETLLAISVALRLNAVETEYVFELAGLGIPTFHETHEPELPEPLEQLVPNIHNVAAVIFDRYITALRWNAIADAMFDFSKRIGPGERNTVHRLLHDPHMPEAFGADFERLAGGVIAMFRRGYFAAEPPPFAKNLYDQISLHPMLSKLWEEHLVADDVFAGSSGPFERHHPVAGSFSIFTSNLIVSRRQGTILRITAPADPASVEIFARLARLGSASAREGLVRTG